MSVTITSSNNWAKTSAPKLQLKVFIIQMNLDTSKNEFGESCWIFTENASKIAGRMGSQGNLSTQVKKSRNTTTSPVSGVGTCSSNGACPLPAGKNPAASYSLIKLVVTLDSPKTKGGGRGPDCFAAIRSLTSASTSLISSSSDLISPSSQILDPLAAGEVWPPVG
jgi:hypothetical protein